MSPFLPRRHKVVAAAALSADLRSTVEEACSPRRRRRLDGV